MNMIAVMREYAVAARELVVPRYRPEHHYMRGPGPACAKRGGIVVVAARRLD
jgi:hypothetical protein